MKAGVKTRRAPFPLPLFSFAFLRFVVKFRRDTRARRFLARAKNFPARPPSQS
jgi:hypothetical protein